MDKTATRLDLIRAGFQGSEVLLRQGSRTLGVLHGGKDSRIHLTGGQSFYVRSEPDGGMSMTEDSGLCAALFAPGRGIQYLGTWFRMIPDPQCPEWTLLQADSGLIGKFHSDFIELFTSAIDPAFLLFAARAIQATKKSFLESTWFRE